jgi:hypothetical protein
MRELEEEERRGEEVKRRPRKRQENGGVPERDVRKGKNGCLVPNPITFGTKQYILPFTHDFAHPDRAPIRTRHIIARRKRVRRPSVPKGRRASRAFDTPANVRLAAQFCRSSASRIQLLWRTQAMHRRLIRVSIGSRGRKVRKIQICVVQSENSAEKVKNELRKIRSWYMGLASF